MPACLASSSYFSSPVAWSTGSGITWSALLAADRWTSLEVVASLEDLASLEVVASLTQDLVSREAIL